MQASNDGSSNRWPVPRQSRQLVSCEEQQPARVNIEEEVQLDRFPLCPGASGGQSYQCPVRAHGYKPGGHVDEDPARAQAAGNGATCFVLTLFVYYLFYVLFRLSALDQVMAGRNFQWPAAPQRMGASQMLAKVEHPSDACGGTTNESEQVPSRQGLRT